MPRGEKPYRVYRGGRVKGRVPLETRPARTPERQPDGRARYRGPGPRRLKRRWGWGRIALVGVITWWPVLAIGLIITVVVLVRWIRSAREEMSELPLSHH